MGKEKFVYNKHTLRYEKVKVSSKERFLRGLGISGVFAAYTALVFSIAPNFMSSPMAKMQEQELTKMQQKYKEINQELNMMSSVLQNIHDRDAGIYREILEMDATDANIWDGGKGGSDKYADLRNLSDSDLLVATSQKLSKLKHQLAVAAESQDDIIKEAKAKEKMLQSIPSIRPIRKLDRKIEHLSGFGMRVHPVYKIRKMHTGIDIGAPKGTPIYATGQGKVVRVEHKSTGYGKSVVIDHGYGYKTLYAHMSKIEVRVGQKVGKGEQIGKVGSTGTSTSPHVHYEVVYKGKKINPIHFCMDGLSPQEYESFVKAAEAENQAMSID